MPSSGSFKRGKLNEMDTGTRERERERDRKREGERGARTFQEPGAGRTPGRYNREREKGPLG